MSEPQVLVMIDGPHKGRTIEGQRIYLGDQMRLTVNWSGQSQSVTYYPVRDPYAKEGLGRDGYGRVMMSIKAKAEVVSKTRVIPPLPEYHPPKKLGDRAWRATADVLMGKRGWYEFGPMKPEDDE